MALLSRRDRGRTAPVRWGFPEIMDWLESPLAGFGSLAPAIRIEEFVAGGRYVVRAELPGVDPDKDVEITVGDGMLDIRAERTSETKEEHRSEFRYGSLRRSVMLPRGANEEDVKASYTDGVLEVSVGLEEEKQPGRRIAVEKG